MNSVAETWRRVWGGRTNFSPTKISERLFLVVDQVFPDFPFFYQIFRIFTMFNVVYGPFLTRKTPFFTLFILSRTSDYTTSQNIGGTDGWTFPPPKIFGGTVPQFP